MKVEVTFQSRGDWDGNVTTTTRKFEDEAAALKEIAWNLARGREHQDTLISIDIEEPPVLPLTADRVRKAILSTATDIGHNFPVYPFFDDLENYDTLTVLEGLGFAWLDRNAEQVTPFEKTIVFSVTPKGKGEKKHFTVTGVRDNVTLVFDWTEGLKNMKQVAPREKVTTVYE